MTSITAWVEAKESVAAGRKNVPRGAEPAMWNMLGWDRDKDGLPGDKGARTTAVKREHVDDPWKSEAASKFVYYVPASQPSPTLLKTAAEATIPTTVVTDSAPDEGEEKSAVAADTVDKTGAEEIGGDETQRTKSKKKTTKKKKKKERKKFQHIGPRPLFFNYGNANTSKPYKHALRTFSTLPADPREIYPSAIRAAAKRPKASAHHMAKFEFMRKQRKEAGEALEDIKSARRRNQKKPSIPKLADLEASNNKEDGTQPPKIARMLRLISNPPSENEGLDMFAIMSWPDDEHEAELKRSAEKTKIKRQEAYEAAAAKEEILAKARPQCTVKSEAETKALSEGFVPFEPESTDEVNPKKYAGLPAKLTKIIPAAGISSQANHKDEESVGNLMAQW